MTKLTKPYKDMTVDEMLEADESRHGNGDPKNARCMELLREQRDRIAELERQATATVPDAEAACALLQKQVGV